LLGRRWLPRARTIPDPTLRAHAVEAITTKWFHCDGGAAYAIGAERSRYLLSAIVSLQTISDYLDTVCDRGNSADGADYRRLHEAMLDAVRTRPIVGGYYALHPEQDDGGYLSALVLATRNALARLPGYPVVEPRVVELVSRYNDLQQFKHLRPRSAGVAAMERWYAEREIPGLDWWEYAAACGSTLGMFGLFRLAAGGKPAPAEIDALAGAYVPWICGLHILLDYFIDQAEDQAVGEVNLVGPYRDEDERRRRLLLFIDEARSRAAKAPDPALHRWVVEGLPGFYLADPKADLPNHAETSRALLAAGTPYTRFVRRLVKVHRRVKPTPSE
jgi:tetraprenyl-beta-curcumene synthase